MKYAYIATQEQIHSYDGTLLGARVCQVQNTKNGLVDVDNLLFWVECADNVLSTTHYYDLNNQEVKILPTKPESI